MAALSGVPAHQITLILQELILFFGEGLFHGKVFDLSFDGLMTMTIKREKTVVGFDRSFVKDLFAIDSRKWPLAVRELAELTITPPSGSRPPTASSASARPKSAHSRPASGAKPIEPRPAFVSCGQAPRLFSEIQNTPRTPRPNTSAKKGPQPVPGRRADVEEEGESVYDILSPERLIGDCPADEEVPYDTPDIEPTSGAPYCNPNDGEDPEAANPVEEGPATAVQNPRRFKPSQSQCSIQELLYASSNLTVPPLQSGKKRYGTMQHDHLDFLFQSTGAAHH
jgi:hypothetical protein